MREFKQLKKFHGDRNITQGIQVRSESSSNKTVGPQTDGEYVIDHN